MSSWIDKLNGVDEQRGKRHRGGKRFATQEPVSPRKRPRLSDSNARILRSSTNLIQSPGFASLSSPLSSKQPPLTPSPPRRSRSNTENSPFLTPRRESAQGLRIPLQSSAAQGTHYLVYPSPPQSSPPSSFTDYLHPRRPKSITATSNDTSPEPVASPAIEEGDSPPKDRSVLLPPFSLGTEELSGRKERGPHMSKRKKTTLRNTCVRKTGCSVPSLPELLVLAHTGGLRHSNRNIHIPQVVAPLVG